LAMGLRIVGQVMHAVQRITLRTSDKIGQRGQGVRQRSGPFVRQAGRSGPLGST
jgi:hypothetical protein